MHLSKNQRFAEAQRWFHYIFDPTDDTSTQRTGSSCASARSAEVTPIDEQLAAAEQVRSDRRGRRAREAPSYGYDAIKNKPFQPHPVAQHAIFPYQYAVVMKYLDNLIAWGDSLFRQDTIESINEATQLYVLAANILGARPQRDPARGTIRPKTFHELKMKAITGSTIGNALVELEGQFPFNLSLPSNE